MVRGLKKTNYCATLKNGIVKIRPGFPSNSPRVLRKHALRKRPQTCLKHVSNARARNTPKSKISLLHYTVSKNHSKNDRKRVAQVGPLEALWGPLGALGRPNPDGGTLEPLWRPLGHPKHPNSPKTCRDVGVLGRPSIGQSSQSKTLKGAAVGPRRGIQYNTIYYNTI